MSLLFHFGGAVDVVYAVSWGGKFGQSRFILAASLSVYWFLGFEGDWWDLGLLSMASSGGLWGGLSLDKPRMTQG